MPNEFLNDPLMTMGLANKLLKKNELNQTISTTTDHHPPQTTIYLYQSTTIQLVFTIINACLLKRLILPAARNVNQPYYSELTLYDNENPIFSVSYRNY